MYPPQRAGVRATTIHDLVPLHLPGVDDQAHARRCTGASTANAARTCDVDVRQLDVHRRRLRRRRSAFPRERVARRASRASAPSSPRTAPAADLGGPYLLTVATLEPRKNLGTLVEAFALLADTGLTLVVVGGAGWGEQPQLDRPGDRPARARRPTTSSRGSTAAPRRSSTRRGSRASGCRSPRRWRRGAPVVASAHPSMDEAARRRGRPRRPREPAGDRGRRSARRSTAATSCARGGSSTRARFSWRRDRRGLPRGVRAIRVALDTTPLVQTRAGTARYVHALREHLDVRVEVSFPATSRLRTVAADALWYPRLRAPRGADVLHCPTFRGPFRARGAARRHRARPRRAAAPRVVQPLDGDLFAPRRAARRRAPRRA